MSTRDRVDGEIPTKKKKVDSSDTGQSNSNGSSERRNLDEVDEIEIVFDGLPMEKKMESLKNSSEAEKVKALTQQLKEFIRREKEMKDQLEMTKGIEESLKEERDTSKGMYDKSIISTRHWKLRAVHAETTLANIDVAKVANISQIRQENILLYKRLGELECENVKLQEKIEKGRLQSDPSDDKFEKLTEEVEKLRKENEEWKEERDRMMKKQEKEESERIKEIDELKADLMRMRKKKDDYADDADHWEKEANYYKEEKMRIMTDLDDAQSKARILKRDKEKWMDDWEEKKKENSKLDKKVKELDSRLKKEGEKCEEMKKKLDSLAAIIRCDSSTQTEDVKCKEEKESEELEKMGSGESTVTAISSHSTPSPSGTPAASRLPSVLRDVNGGSSDVDAELEKLRKEVDKWRNLLDIELDQTERLELELREARNVIEKMKEEKKSAEKKIEKCDISCQTEKMKSDELEKLKRNVELLTLSLGDATMKIKRLNAEKDRLTSSNNVPRPIVDHWERNTGQPTSPQQLQSHQHGPAFPLQPTQWQQQFVHHPQQHPQSFLNQSHQSQQFVQQPRQPQQQSSTHPPSSS